MWFGRFKTCFQLIWSFRMQWYGPIVEMRDQKWQWWIIKERLPDQEASEGHHGGRWRWRRRRCTCFPNYMCWTVKVENLNALMEGKIGTLWTPGYVDKFVVESENWWRPILTNLRTGSLARWWKSGIKLVYSKSLVKESRNKASKWLYIRRDNTIDRYGLRSSV